MRELANRFPVLKGYVRTVRDKIFGGNLASTGFERLTEDQVAGVSNNLRDAWKSEEIPARQREIVDNELARFRNGKPVKVFDVAIEALNQLPYADREFSLLDVGCASGFYSEVFELSGFRVKYTGCDYSDALIASAKNAYPDALFDVEDATRLSYRDSSFDVVVSGCCLLHIPEYEIAIAESARVASGYVIFHRTPVVVSSAENIYSKKKAYGVDVMEIHFGEAGFLQSLLANGLRVISTHTLHEEIAGMENTAVRTYVCEKITV